MLLSDDGKTLLKADNGEINEDGSYEIPQGITAIDDNAFGTCTKLQKISLPKGVVSIGDFAFYSCTNLKQIHLPEGVISIGDGAFHSCTKLQHIHLPKSITLIGDGAFYGCSKLQRINIPKRVISIGVVAFYGCSNLRIFLDSLKDEIASRLTRLLPDELKNKVVAYTEKQVVHLWAQHLNKIIEVNQPNYRIGFFQVLPDEMLIHINRYVEHNNFYHLDAKKLMSSVDLPLRPEDRGLYEKKIEEIASVFIREAQDSHREQNSEEENKGKLFGLR
ncbi:leucine-rich repeat domain-containing protein [Fluoribacter gormanii]|uniref:leucine-rich repeat domain-containing protein n=1 Tax=Fluoribacter gormanii TaxID=464 RepID=UPI00104140F6|nr:leucine-rich repeat domain-containing protein [Fluoribacter gormanii]